MVVVMPIVKNKRFRNHRLQKVKIQIRIHIVFKIQKMSTDLDQIMERIC